MQRPLSGLFTQLRGVPRQQAAAVDALRGADLRFVGTALSTTHNGRQRERVVCVTATALILYNPQGVLKRAVPLHSVVELRHDGTQSVASPEQLARQAAKPRTVAVLAEGGGGGQRVDILLRFPDGQRGDECVAALRSGVRRAAERLGRPPPRIARGGAARVAQDLCIEKSPGRHDADLFKALPPPQHAPPPPPPPPRAAQPRAAAATRDAPREEHPGPPQPEPPPAPAAERASFDEGADCEVSVLAHGELVAWVPCRVTRRCEDGKVDIRVHDTSAAERLGLDSVVAVGVDAAQLRPPPPGRSAQWLRARAAAGKADSAACLPHCWCREAAGARDGDEEPAEASPARPWRGAPGEDGEVVVLRHGRSKVTWVPCRVTAARADGTVDVLLHHTRRATRLGFAPGSSAAGIERDKLRPRSDEGSSDEDGEAAPAKPKGQLLWQAVRGHGALFTVPRDDRCEPDCWCLAVEPGRLPAAPEGEQQPPPQPAPGDGPSGEGASHAAGSPTAALCPSAGVAPPPAEPAVPALSAALPAPALPRPAAQPPPAPPPPEPGGTPAEGGAATPASGSTAPRTPRSPQSPPRRTPPACSHSGPDTPARSAGPGGPSSGAVRSPESASPALEQPRQPRAAAPPVRSPPRRDSPPLRAPGAAEQAGRREAELAQLRAEAARLLRLRRQLRRRRGSLEQCLAGAAQPTCAAADRAPAAPRAPAACLPTDAHPLPRAGRSPPAPSPRPVAPSSRRVALYDFAPREDDELALARGDEVDLLGCSPEPGWGICLRLSDAVVGQVPLSYLRAC